MLIIVHCFNSYELSFIIERLLIYDQSASFYSWSLLVPFRRNYCSPLCSFDDRFRYTRAYMHIYLHMFPRCVKAAKEILCFILGEIYLFSFVMIIKEFDYKRSFFVAKKQRRIQNFTRDVASNVTCRNLYLIDTSKV